MKEHVTERLSDYLDGELAPAAAESVRAHLAECAECAQVLDELRAVVAEAVRLEDVPAPVGLWHGIDARLRPRRRGLAGLTDRLRSLPARIELPLPQLAAAAFVLMFLSGAAVWLAMRQPVQVPERPIAGAPGAAGARPPAGSTGEARTPVPRSESSQAALATFDDAGYDAAVAELERVLRDHGSQLDTTTVRILQQNLEIIDRAIEQARRALLADPANPYLNGHLAEQMKLKIRLLQRASEVVAAHG